MSPSVDHVKALIERFLRDGSTAAMVPATIPETLDLRAEGLVDSLGFLQLVSDLEQAVGFELDLSELEPEQLTVFGSLAHYVALRGTQGVARTRDESDVVTRSTL